MKKISILALMLALFVPAALVAGIGNDKPSTATKWNIDRAHTNVTFNIRHFFTPVVGKFKAYTIDLNFDPENLAESNVSVEIDVTSVDTGNSNRDNHLQSGDFFETEVHPKMTFTSSSITKTGDNTYVMAGELKIKDVAKQVEIPFTLLGVQDHPTRENTLVAGFESSFTLNRLEYGVGSGNWVSTAVVSDELTVNLFLSVNRPK